MFVDNNRGPAVRMDGRGKVDTPMGGCESGDGRDKTWRTYDPSRTCKGCEAVGLRYGSTSGYCGKCWSKLSGLIKANINDLTLSGVIERYKIAMADEFGVNDAATKMQVDPDQLRRDLDRWKAADKAKR